MFTDFTPILMLLLGWTLGLLSPGIHERIRRRYRRRDLTRSVMEELATLQFTLALLAYMIRARQGTNTDAFIDSILPIIEAYKSPDSDPTRIEAYRAVRAQPERERLAQAMAAKNPRWGLQLKQYSLPFISSQTADLAICTLDFQRAISHIRFQLDIYNQTVQSLESLFEKTFTVSEQSNHAALINNCEQGYRDLGNRAEAIVNVIEQLKKKQPQG
jgi:hypothetical protein